MQAESQAYPLSRDIPSGYRMRFYWLPFPGAFQCVIEDAFEATKSEGMGASKDAAREVAEKLLR